MVWRCGIVLFTTIALAVSAYLASVSLQGADLIGCTNRPQFDCSQAVGGRWSRWFGIPVSLLGAALYAEILLAGVFVATGRPRAAQPTARHALALSALVAAGAAVWFLGVMAFGSNKLCPYCLVVHVSGLAAAVCALIGVEATGETSADAARLPWIHIRAAAACAVTALVLGQWLGPPPRTYEVRPLVAATPAESLGETEELFPVIPPDVPMRPLVDELSKSNRTAIPGRGANRNLSAYPGWGEPSARYVIVEMLDYSCAHCRQVHLHLKQAAKRFGPGFVVVALPTPMCSDCNPYVEGTLPDHVEACHYARLALAVWSVDRSKFAGYHDWLFAPDRPPSVADATAKAAELVGRAALERELHGPRVKEVLDNNLLLYHLLGEGQVPKVIMGNYVVNGAILNEDDLFGMMEDYLGMHPQ
jgi:uncharacterized membrane protein/protein-disulfide isomerase